VAYRLGRAVDAACAASPRLILHGGGGGLSATRWAFHYGDLQGSLTAAAPNSQARLVDMLVRSLRFSYRYSPSRWPIARILPLAKIISGRRDFIPMAAVPLRIFKAVEWRWWISHPFGEVRLESGLAARRAVRFTGK